ncbi:hypothetical protein NLI96_g7455 [Meripilus lineatus]|uniref:Uncharacterized protein n=1 Tax=Meripilus lineatus TaxID=2056292 RepID=A0AAD5V0W1_9APHY|nr:hypothetical protein NLI96_g7455 [Physisporinus lineatus]
MFSQPLGGDPHREREGLVGLAVAEASRLWNYSGRPMDTFALRAALESAANTASMLYYRKLGREVGVPPPPRTDIYERDYAYGEDHPLHRNSKRPSIPSVIRTGSVGGMTPPGTVRTGPVPIPRARTSSFGGGLPGTVGSSPSMYNGGAGGSPYAAGAGLPYAGSGSPYAGGGSPYVGNGSPYQGRGSPYRAGGSPYLGGSAIGGGVVPPYAGSAGIPGAGAPYPGGSQMMAGQPGGVYPGPLPPGQYGYTQPGVVPCQVAFPPQGSMLMQGGNGVPYPTQGSMYAGSVGGGVIPGQVGSAYSASGMIPGTTAYAGGTMPGYTREVKEELFERKTPTPTPFFFEAPPFLEVKEHGTAALVVQSVPVGGGYDTGGSWYR